MPSTRAQHLVFSILMAFAMVYGMELYNQALMAGGLTTELFLVPFGDMVPLMAAVIVLEALVGGKVAHHCTFKFLRAGEDPALLITVFLGIFTCWTMCPMMSFVATTAFKQPPLSARCHVAANYGDELSHGASVAALRGRPGGALLGALAVQAAVPFWGAAASERA